MGKQIKPALKIFSCAMKKIWWKLLDICCSSFISLIYSQCSWNSNVNRFRIELIHELIQILRESESEWIHSKIRWIWIVNRFKYPRMNQFNDTSAKATKMETTSRYFIAFIRDIYLNIESPIENFGKSLNVWSKMYLHVLYLFAASFTCK